MKVNPALEQNWCKSYNCPITSESITSLVFSSSQRYPRNTFLPLVQISPTPLEMEGVIGWSDMSLILLIRVEDRRLKVWIRSAHASLSHARALWHSTIALQLLFAFEHGWKYIKIGYLELNNWLTCCRFDWNIWEKDYLEAGSLRSSCLTTF